MAYTPTGNPAGWDGHLRGTAHRMVIEEGQSAAAAVKFLKESGATDQVIANFKVNITSPTSVAKAARAKRSRERAARKAKEAAKDLIGTPKKAAAKPVEDLIGTPKKAPAKAAKALATVTPIKKAAPAAKAPAAKKVAAKK